ncbi:hypothetical protein STSP_21540 [Streptomyces jeddahensis]|uniref:Uncharacterized protein n=1 Tax=Streptomyces jeddahensis TaxID=1716141 RepID=A0A177HUT9_9ACTN|nr:hypothetical protein STSP_21540 [Streptomyces jeddahensis]
MRCGLAFGSNYPYGPGNSAALPNSTSAATVPGRVSIGICLLILFGIALSREGSKRVEATGRSEVVQVASHVTWRG